MRTILVIVMLFAFSSTVKSQIASELSYDKLEETVSLTLENLTDSTFRLCNPADSIFPRNLTYFTVKYLGAMRNIVYYSYRVTPSMSMGGEKGKGVFLLPKEKKNFKIRLRPETKNLIYYIQIGVHIEVVNSTNSPNFKADINQNLFIKEISETYPTLDAKIK